MKTMDSGMQHLRFSDYPQLPWKNGRGVTRQIAAAPGAGGRPPAWRISMATISEHAMFSTFPGLDRSLAVVNGAGIELTVDGVSRALGVGDEPARFAGDSPASARPIDGGTPNLNLMVDPLRATGSITAALAGEHELPDGTWFVVALADSLELRIEGDESLVVDRLDTVMFEVDARRRGCVSLVPRGRAPDGPVIAYLVSVLDQPQAPR